MFNKLLLILHINFLNIELVYLSFQSMSLGGVAFFLVLVTYTSSYSAALLCMALSLTCGGFHGAGILVNPQDLAPKFSGSVFGKFSQE